MLVWIKVLHTVVWAVFVACIGGIFVVASAGRFGWALLLIGLVFGEVLVLVVNRMRCPLTPLAARFTEDRRPDFDIFLPEWLARYNKEIFGSLYAGGILFALVLWLRAPAPAPTLFLPGVVSQPGVSRAYVALAADGQTLYLARYERFGGDGLVSIEVARRQNGGWTAPRTASFSGTYHDHQPSLSPDGRYLYFISKRPVDGVPRDDYEPWRVEIRGDGFGAPEHLAELGGASSEYAPFVAKSGRIYFSSDREGGQGSGDLYVAEPEGERFGAPRNVGAPVNAESGEWGSTLDDAESLLVFESSNRAQSLSDSGDLYFSRRINGVWTAPRHFPAPINSAASDLAPRIASDGRRLLFSTNRDGAVATFEVDLEAALAAADPALIFATSSAALCWRRSGDRWRRDLRRDRHGVTTGGVGFP